ncbi:hypothetical protein KFL_015520010, partial [Klebsormidium nitens]
VVFAVCLFSSGGTILFLTTRTAEKSLERLANDYQQSIMDRALDSISNLFASEAACIQSLAGYIELAESDYRLPNTTERVRDLLVYQATLSTLSSGCELDGVGVFFDSGRYFYLERPTNASDPLANGTLTIRFNRDLTAPLGGATLPQFISMVNATTGEPLSGDRSRVTLGAPQEYRNRSWYQDAMTSANGKSLEIRVGPNGRPALVAAQRAILSTSHSGSRIWKTATGIGVAIAFVGCLVVYLLTNPITKEMRLKAELLRNMELRQHAEMREEIKTKFMATIR